MVWVVLKMDKSKNTFDELIRAAIPGAKIGKLEAPIEKAVRQPNVISKKIMKLKRKLVSFNVKFDFED